MTPHEKETVGLCPSGWTQLQLLPGSECESRAKYCLRQYGEHEPQPIMAIWHQVLPSLLAFHGKLRLHVMEKICGF